MNVITSDRGFQRIEHPTYANDPESTRLVGQSSAINFDYADAAYDRPGTSYLWIGEHHHLDRQQVAELVTHLQSWLATGKL